MLRVNTFEHDGKNIQLLPELDFSDSNTYTVIVGKNGVGKSRLLASICRKKTAHFYANFKFSDPEPLVIAASTSPFDKFPNVRKKNSELPGNYRYVGMRGEGMYSASSAISLISSASKALLEKLLHGRNNTYFLEILDSLSFDTNARFIFKPSFSKVKDFDEPAPYSSRPRIQLTTDDGADKIILDERYASLIHAMATETRSSVTYAMSNVADYFDSRKAVTLNVDFASNNFSFEGKKAYPQIINSILILLNHNLIRLMDVVLHKKTHGELSLKRASSGEQCLIVLTLGIAGHIEDGSLILIDEPEISLHPRWQEEFMPLLISAFSNYKNCHFIIATHSPQIVARMNDESSYIYSLSQDKLYPAKYFSDKSADFQLAELFDAPGMKNEYISRVSFNLIAKLRSKRKVDLEIKADLLKLLELQSKLEDLDPTIFLIDSAKELYDYYARN